MIPGYKLVLDISHHQKIDYKLVSPHIDGVIARTHFGTQPDNAFVQHYEGFMAEGKPVAAYQWFRPDQDVKAQVEAAKLVLDKTRINMMFSDQEQHGLYALGAIVPPYYPADKLSALGQSHITGLQTHGFEMGIYSRATWISQWAKPIMGWLILYRQWLASWPFAKGAVTTSWEDLKSSWAPKVFSPYLTADWPPYIPKAEAWQWSGDKFILPGIYTTQGAPRPVDLNYVSDELFARFLKPEIVQPPVHVPDPSLSNLHGELVDLKLRISADMVGRMERYTALTTTIETANTEDKARHDALIQELDYILGLVKGG